MARSLFVTKFLVRTRLARLLPSARRLTDGHPEYLKYYSDRVLAAPVEELLDPALVPEPSGPEVIDLNHASPRFDSAVSQNRLAADRRGTPPAWGLPELRGAVADLAARRDGVEIDPESQVLVTHGATAAFAAAVDAFVNPGDRVVLFDPTSPLFTLGAKSRRARLSWVPTWTEDGRCRFITAGLERAMRGAKLIAFADPHNPTGACFSPEDDETIARLAARFDVLVYRDDSFGRFRYGAKGPAFETLPAAEGRTLTAGSASAGYGLGSVRVGWLAGPKPLVRACALTANLSAPFVPAACQQLAARALKESDEAAFAPVREQYRSRRQYAYDRLKAMGLEPDWPEGGYFLWVPVAPLGLDGRAFAERLYRERQVLVGPGATFGPGGGGHVRLSFAVEDGRLREGIARLGAFVASLRAPTAVGSVADVLETVEVGEGPPAEDELKPAFSRV